MTRRQFRNLTVFFLKVRNSETHLLEFSSIMQWTQSLTASQIPLLRAGSSRTDSPKPAAFLAFITTVGISCYLFSGNEMISCNN